MLVKYRVKELAKSQGLTQFELAAKAGVSLSAVQRLWQNRTPEGVRHATLDAVAQALAVQIEDLHDASSGEDAKLRVNRPSLGAVAA